VTVQGFEAIGLDRASALDAIRRSVELARRAATRHAAVRGLPQADLLVAGSVGPYGAMLADGSEYRGDYDPGEATFRALHAPRIDALLDAGVDLLALETIPTMREAEVLVRLVGEAGGTAWLSYQCRDGATTAAGEPIVDAIAMAAGEAGIVAVGVNCTAPRYVAGLLGAARTVSTAPFIAYPNGGDTWDAAARRWRSEDRGGRYDPTAVAALAEVGATWLGGCCGTGPAAIAALAAAIRSR
jgi:homocysteine S-methyltransferase